MTALGSDPAVRAIAKALYGDTVSAEDFAKQIDAEDVHIDGPMSAARRARRKRPRVVKVEMAKYAGSDDPKKGHKAAAIGLGASSIASVAGVHALTATKGENAARRARLAGELPKVEEPGKVAAKLAAKVGPVKAAGIIGGGLLALHGVELAGDALAIHTQASRLRKPKDLHKGLRVSVRPVNPEQVKQAVSLRARRPAGSPAVSKGIVGNVKTATAAGAKATENVEEITRKVAHLVPKRKAAIAGTVGLATALGGGQAVGTYEGAKHGVRRGLRKAAVELEQIAKFDDERRQVFGWANVSVKDNQVVVDRQGDIIPIDELEKAAYDYVQESRVGADQHQRISKDLVIDVPRQTGSMIESMVFTPEKIEKMGLPQDFPQGWWIGMQITDEPTWQAIKRGERTGFSIHGVGQRTPLEGVLDSPFGKAADRREPDLDPMHTRQVSAVARRAPGAGRGLRARYEQAKNPPPVRREQTPDSTAMSSLGYQRQTRKMDVEMRSRPGDPYSYRVKPSTARAVLGAPSKGRAYTSQIRNKAPRHERYRASDRARLFLSPA